LKSIAIVSGGLDSTVLSYLMAESGEEINLISFDYGQRHIKELESASALAKRLKARHEIVNLGPLQKLISGSALTSMERSVPEGHYAAANMAATVVPNRNAIMLAIAYGWAVNIGATEVGIGVHAGDHPIYPDCRDEFIRSFDLMEKLATQGYAEPELYLFAPFINRTKAQVVELGHSLGVPFDKTWSCYAGGANHCGRCGTCVERKEAFAIAKVVDPTMYEDAEYEIAAYRG
jgi:7-cyano-7-deazaguanine synthase